MVQAFSYHGEGGGDKIRRGLAASTNRSSKIVISVPGNMLPEGYYKRLRWNGDVRVKCETQNIEMLK